MNKKSISSESKKDSKTLLMKVIGYGLFTLSTITFFLCLSMPFWPLTSTEKAAWAGGFYIASQITWWLCLPFIGKDMMLFVGGIKHRLLERNTELSDAKK